MAFGIKITKTSGLGGSFSPAQILAKVGPRLAKRIEKDVDDYGKKMRGGLADQTPYRTGQTARAWRFEDRPKGFKVKNDKPWVGGLNEGRWVSRSQTGGPRPRKGWVESTIKKTKPKR